MNNFYPPWWNTTITIYNKFEDKQTNIVTWHRFTISNCFWKYTGDKVTINDVVLDTNNIICRIPKQDNFLERYEWEKIPNDQMSEYFTLSVGDIIVKGEIEDTIDEYTSGSRSTDLVKKYKKLQGCLQIEEVAINTEGGRGSEHYFVKGI